MNISETQVVRTPADTATKTMAGGLLGEAIGSIAVIALSIVGLAGIFSATMAAIGTIILGAALLVEEGIFTGTTDALMRLESPSSALLGGLTGVVLGVLALLGQAPETLLGAATIVFGAALLFGQFSHLAEADFGSRAMVGIASVVLGILAVVGLTPLTLVLVALLSLGAVELFHGAANSAKIALAHRHVTSR